MYFPGGRSISTTRFFLRSPFASATTPSCKEAQPGGEENITGSQKAMALDRTAALESTSWGLFQIMGFNYAAVNLRSVEELVAALYKSEGEQLKLFSEFVKKTGLADALRHKSWTDFARRYNGPDYGDYDKRMERAYRSLI